MISISVNVPFCTCLLWMGIYNTFVSKSCNDTVSKNVIKDTLGIFILVLCVVYC